MSGYSFHNHGWWCDEVAIHDLAVRYGTPLYVYSRNRIVENFIHITAAFKPLNAHIHYSVKANADGTILKLLRDLGSGFDVVSGGELFRVLRMGADPATIVFAGVGKTEHELAYALDNHVGWINVESSQELELLDRLAAARSLLPAIALRINPAVDADTHHHIATGGHRSKFGIDLDEARLILQNTNRYPHLEITGLHIHIGSQLASPDATIDAVQRALELTYLHSIRLLDIGGGFPVAYQPDDHFPEPGIFAEALTRLLSSPLRSTPEAKRSGAVPRPLPQVAIEPGRSIIADAGALIAEVQYVKLRAGRRIIVTDASMTELIRPALYEAYHHIVAVNGGEPTDTLADVVGPVCESADQLGIDRALPVVQRGDQLLILTTGAYGSSMASNYNSRPRPAEVMVEGSTHRLIRRREAWEDLVAFEA
jgi:diaminopimelate decarboxylase